MPKKRKAGTRFCSEILLAHWVAFVLRDWTIGSLSNDDSGGNENDKKATGLDIQNNNFARASRFFAYFSAATVRLRGENT